MIETGPDDEKAFKSALKRQFKLLLAALFITAANAAPSDSSVQWSAHWQSVASAKATLNLVSWNMEWLADAAALDNAHFWTECPAALPDRKLRSDLPVCDAYQKDGLLTAQDYARKKLVGLRGTLRRLAAQGMDVLAVQEVQNPAALSAVLPPGYHVECFTSRIDAQNVGYALRNGMDLHAACREIQSLSLENDPAVAHPVRRGLELSIDLPGTKQRMALLNVHLKASCVSGPMTRTDNPSCATLQRQAAPLAQWMQSQAAADVPFLIVGDWNRDLEAELHGRYPALDPAPADASTASAPSSDESAARRIRNLWPEINELAPQARMTLASVDRHVALKRACHDVLDQLAVSMTLRDRLAPASLNLNGAVRAGLTVRPAAASDHCPLRARLMFR